MTADKIHFEPVSSNAQIIDGNEAAVRIAYKVTDANTIYPITPSSTMGELADEWAAKGIKNIWGTVPQIIEMQSEGGASGALHGALQAGAMATTYTSSQGLLLMVPNMFKIAGELTAAVIHIAARPLAVQALSIFGDLNDVMAVRATGFAMLCSGSVQEAHDLALIAHAATLEARVPFMHFFEGFRTSHEINKIEALTDEEIRQMIPEELVEAHRKRALNPDQPIIRGTSQNPDTYFQGRETVNKYYEATLQIVENCMEKFHKMTGRRYDLVQYFGTPDAERVIIVLGIGAKVAAATAERLNAEGEKVGVIQMYLYRPFPAQQLLQALPKTIKSIAVLDRTKESGAIGEPVYQDVVTVLGEAIIAGTLPFAMPKVIGGRYGLSSKDFTPSMAKAVFDELKKVAPKNHFTVGINDDVTHTSLDYDRSFVIEPEQAVRAIFYGLGADGTVSANKNTIKIIGGETDYYAQGYFVYDSKKSGSKTVSHLRFGPKPIVAPYLIQTANFIGCHQFIFVKTSNVLANAAMGATFLLNSPYPADQVWEKLPRVIQEEIIEKKIKFYVVDGYKVAQTAGIGNRINTVLQTCFFAISEILPQAEAIEKIKAAIAKTYKAKGEEIIAKNFKAVDQALAGLAQVKVPDKVSPNAAEFPPIVSSEAPAFVREVIAELIAERGDDVPVSKFPIDGTFPTGTTKWEKRNISPIVAKWDGDTCIQCGQCSMICPHAVIRAKKCSTDNLKNAPAHFMTKPVRNSTDVYHLQVYVEDCTGCGLCTVVCPAVNKTTNKKAINLAPKEPILEQERENIKFFENLPDNERTSLDTKVIRDAQFLCPLFEFSGACAGCGETPYLKLVSQLFGDRMLAGNATGCTSIYGGNLPTTPWAFNRDGRGPSWSNSLFEDNAEFGFGLRIAVDKHREQAVELLTQLANELGDDLVTALKQGAFENNEAAIKAQRERIVILKNKLAVLEKNVAARLLLSLIDNLVPRSVWLIGGDGWAYDIGYGGLDHVVASARNVNILVLDTEVYSNTGGQASKATPRSAVAKFAYAGKSTARKDLGLIAMSYGNVYVTQIAMGANPAHALRAIQEAESYNGVSLIIAYAHCITHGINTIHGVEQQKLAVLSGFWPLYRYNPLLIQEGKNPLQLDSQAPSIPVTQFAYNEARFKSLLTSYPERAALLMKELQEDVDRKWKLYEKLAKDN